MAIPTKTESLNTFVTSTFEYRRDGLVDNWSRSAPLLIYMRKKKRMTVKGGRDLREAIVYAGFPGSSYGPGDEFDTSVREFATELIFNWKYSYIPVNLNVMDVEHNDGPMGVFDLVDAALNNAEISMIDELATQLFGDGTGNAGKDLTGLAIAVSQTGVYGGITRSSGVEGTSIQAGVENTTGGVLSLAGANVFYQGCKIAREAPDLMVTTQTLWNRFWERSQPSERNRAGGEREIGMDSVHFNNADVYVDSHCPAGFLYFLNTDYWSYYLHTGWDFVFRGFKEPVNQQRMIGQVISWGNLCCQSPRLQGVASGLS